MQMSHYVKPGFPNRYNCYRLFVRSSWFPRSNMPFHDFCIRCHGEQQYDHRRMFPINITTNRSIPGMIRIWYQIVRIVIEMFFGVLEKSLKELVW